MANLKKTLTSGAVLEATLSSFQEGMDLLKAVTRELEKNPRTMVIASDDIQNALWPCLHRALYNNQKITKDLFEEEKNREDFLEVAREVLQFNLLPFTKNLSSLLPEALAKSMNSPGSK